MRLERLRRPLAGALLILGATAAIRWLQPEHLDGDGARRLVGVLLGAVVVVYANAIPKVLAAHRRRGGAPGADQAMRRYAGWAMVLGGIGYMLAWLFAPIGGAAAIGGATLALALLAAIARCLRSGARDPRH